MRDFSENDGWDSDPRNDAETIFARIIQDKCPDLHLKKQSDPGYEESPEETRRVCAAIERHYTSYLLR